MVYNNNQNYGGYNYPNQMMSYGNQYMTPNYYQQVPQQQIQPMPQSTNQSNYLMCKIVDSMDIAKIQEIPMGSAAVFPKADMTEVYVKNWNSDGTTGVIKYIPVNTTEDKVEEENIINKRLDDISDQLKKLTETVNSLFE